MRHDARPRISDKSNSGVQGTAVTRVEIKVVVELCELAVVVVVFIMVGVVVRVVGIVLVVDVLTAIVLGIVLLVSVVVGVRAKFPALIVTLPANQV